MRVMAIGLMLLLAGCGGDKGLQPDLDTRLVGRWVPPFFITSATGVDTVNPVMMLLDDGSYWERGIQIGLWQVISAESGPDGVLFTVQISVSVTRYTVSLLLVRDGHLRILTNDSGRGPLGSYDRENFDI